ncbi:hypothetical protein U9M48_042233 [Paspalum notatum var. saurae]|uniref:Integrase catalytic domain-containing protein n=1 Tax=Paspalum notatum var. saurae TaxID=547442 RepID=A0AAQ3UQ53_PASNO
MFASAVPPLVAHHPPTSVWGPVQPPPPTWPPGWAQTTLAHSFTTVGLPPLLSTDWIADSGASFHTTPNAAILSSVRPPLPSFLPFFHHADNSCFVEFDSSGLTVKDSASRRPLLRCDSSGPLYTLRLPTSIAPISTSPSHPSSAAFATTTSSTTCHSRLGHPGRDALAQLSRCTDITCPKTTDEHLCHACQLGRYVRLPFPTSSHASHIFDLIHCDLWTSPLPSIFGYKYYLVVLDDFSHYSWTFPLRSTSEAFSTISHLFAWVFTQFGLTIKAVQCDNGRESDNNASRSFFLSRGVQLRMSCPYTSPQNGKAERMIRTTNDVMRTLLFQASLPARFWAESLHTATYLLNRLPSTASPAPTPHHALFGTPSRYDHLRVFGCAGYPNTSATAPHKLAPRSTRCVFLGYSPDHKGYRCFDLTSRRVVISRHVVFDESDFPFSITFTPASDLELESLSPTDPVVQPPLSERSTGPLPAPFPDVLDPSIAHRWATRGPIVPCCAMRGLGGPVVPRCAMRSPRGPVIARCAMRGPGASHALSPARVRLPASPGAASGATVSGIFAGLSTACAGAGASRAIHAASARL